MKTSIKIILILFSILITNSCIVYKKAPVSTRENLRNLPDIRIYAIYTISGDTIPIDHSSVMVTRISDYEIKFIDREGNIRSVPINEIEGLLIRQENRPATIALKVTGIVLVVGVTVALMTFLILTMLTALSA